MKFPSYKEWSLQVLPNPVDTFQMWKRVEISQEEQVNYDCMLTVLTKPVTNNKLPHFPKPINRRVETDIL